MPRQVGLSNFVFDYFLAFCLGILFAVTINGEAQAFMAQLLGDVRQEDNARFHFNPLRHLHVLGTLAFFISGFGWPRSVDVDSGRFKRPKLYTAIVRFAGPAANFLLASIISSVSLIIEQFAIDPQMLEIVLGVNLMAAVSNLIPVPPLAGGSIAAVLIPERYGNLRKAFWRFSPYLLVLLLAADRLSHSEVINRFCKPLFEPVFNFFTKSYSFG
jgi:Zn-dependent protease